MSEKVNRKSHIIGTRRCGLSTLIATIHIVTDRQYCDSDNSRS